MLNTNLIGQFPYNKLSIDVKIYLEVPLSFELVQLELVECTWTLKAITITYDISINVFIPKN